jgi:hypothetical protein
MGRGKYPFYETLFNILQLYIVWYLTICCLALMIDSKNADQFQLCCQCDTSSSYQLIIKSKYNNNKKNEEKKKAKKKG